MPEGRAQSRRDGPIVAWHEVPGTAPPPKNRPVGHGMIRRRPSPRGISRRKVRRVFLRKANHSNHRIGAHTGANQTVPSGTGGKVPSGRRTIPNSPIFAPFRARLFWPVGPQEPRSTPRTYQSALLLHAIGIKHSLCWSCDIRLGRHQ
jgi:hypothetical protein